MSDIVDNFRKKTDKLFHRIDGYSAREIEEILGEEIQKIIVENNLTIIIKDIIISGSRCRGLERIDSDLDVVIFYSGREREDVLFDMFYAKGIWIGEVEVDINPISEEKTGTLAEYLTGVEAYLDEKRHKQQKRESVRENLRAKKKVIVREKDEEHAITLEFTKSNNGCSIL